MKELRIQEMKGKPGGMLAALSLLVAALLFSPVAARADDDHDRERHRERHRGTHLHKRHHGYARREVPRRIYYRDRRAFQSYYAGSVYYRPHHHQHRAYHLPVFIDGVVVYRPFFYCEDHLFLTASAHLPRLAIGIEFGSPGVVYEPGYDPYYDHDEDDDCEDEDDD